MLPKFSQFGYSSFSVLKIKHVWIRQNELIGKAALAVSYLAAVDREGKLHNVFDKPERYLIGNVVNDNGQALVRHRNYWYLIAHCKIPKS